MGVFQLHLADNKLSFEGIKCFSHCSTNGKKTPLSEEVWWKHVIGLRKSIPGGNNNLPAECSEEGGVCRRQMTFHSSYEFRGNENKPSGQVGKIMKNIELGFASGMRWQASKTPFQMHIWACGPIDP
ncbi:hypothetical protein JTE90_022958 [Oedothorax gibbosus]|uniref:Uncharacterized protein n=1 Tax=Oedothorax gibbosus TaxID=931172 RepID=A0AAV6VB97_9ARAC|nr:hypothetical protein JTE90_022958 [Oedothorax gibbosus]